MATELGTAYVSIAASTGGLGKDVTSAVTGGLRQSTARAAGIGGALGGVVGAGLTAGIGAAWRGIKTVVGAGLSRAMNIEDAQAKLRGLGHDAGSVSNIMDNALASVEGTAFGLDAAATVAASAVAAGIEPGEELESVLSTVANTAAASGTSMEDMGSIFNKVASTGKAQNDSLQQLADRGIPIYQALADQLGVTTDEVFEMASAGEIGFAEFEQAASSAAGNVAEEMGGTLTGSLSNLKAAVGRAGAGFFTPLMDSMSGGLSGITGLIDSTLAPALEGAGTMLANFISGIDFESLGGTVSTAIQPIIDAFTNVDWATIGTGLGNILTSLGTASGAIGISTWQLLAIALQMIAGILEFLTPSIEALGTFMSQNQELVTTLVAAWTLYRVAITMVRVAQLLLNAIMMANPVGLIIAGIMLLVAAFIWLWNNVEGFRNFWIGLWEGIKAAALAVANWFTGTLVPFFQGVWTAIVNGARQLGQWLSTVWQSIQTVASTVWNAIKTVILTVWNAIKTAITTVVNAIKTVITTVFNLIKAVVTGDTNAVKSIITSVWNAIKGVVSSVVGAIRSAISSAFNAISSTVSSVMSSVQSFISNAWNTAVSLVSGAMSSMASAVSTGISNVLSFVSGLPGQIQGFFSGAGQWLLDAGRNIIQGLIDGIQGMIGAAGDAISSVVSTIRDFLPFSPAKKGPLSGHGWTGYSGQALVRDFAEGMVKTTSDATDAASGLATDVADAMAVDQSMAVGNRVARGAARANVNLPASQSTPDAVAAALASMPLELIVDGRVLASSTRKAMVDQNIWPVQARVKRAGAYA